MCSCRAVISSKTQGYCQDTLSPLPPAAVRGDLGNFNLYSLALGALHGDTVAILSISIETV